MAAPCAPALRGALHSPRRGHTAPGPPLLTLHLVLGGGALSVLKERESKRVGKGCVLQLSLVFVY